MSGNKLDKERPSKCEHYLNRAKVTAERSSCLRRKVGAVVIKDDAEVSSGYVGAPRGSQHCDELERCPRRERRIPSGENYELCRSVHAEQNAIINAARTGANIRDGEMYISSGRIHGEYDEGGERREDTYTPCTICMKEIINVGLKTVYMREEDVDVVTSFTVEQLMEMLREEEQRLRDKFHGSIRDER